MMVYGSSQETNLCSINPQPSLPFHVKRGKLGRRHQSQRLHLSPGKGPPAMTVDTAKVTGRRKLRFNSIAEAIADAESVTLKPYRTVGNWTAGQILDHLARTVRIMFDGPHGQAPWFLRTFVAPFMRKKFVTTSMPSGFQFRPQMEPFRPEENADAKTALCELRKHLTRLEKEAPTAPHPFFGRMTHEEWIGLHLRHCELHLSFIVPTA